MGFTLPNMATIRFSGIASPPADAHAVFAALSRLGFGRLRIFDGSSALPDGWPQEDLPPLQAGESYARGEGRWESTADPISHVNASGGGAFSFFNVWVHENYSGGSTPSPTPPREPSSPGGGTAPSPGPQGGPNDPPPPQPREGPGPAPSPSVLTSPTAGADVGVALGIGVALVIGIAIAASRRASASRERALRPVHISGDKQLGAARRYVSGLRQSAKGA